MDKPTMMPSYNRILLHKTNEQITHNDRSLSKILCQIKGHMKKRIYRIISFIYNSKQVKLICR